MSEENKTQKKIEIIPAIMPAAFEELESYAAMFAGLADTVQIDVMDGRFVSPKSWPFAERDGSFENIISESEGLPMWQKLNYEADLMIASVETDLEKWMHAGVKRIIVHYESLNDPDEFFNREIFSGNAPREFLSFGISLNNDTPEEKIFPYLESGKVDFVQCMGIAKIGYQGEPFDERVLPKIESLRKHFEELIISVDGSVNTETAPRLVRAGATRLVSGSAILENPDPKEAIKALCAAAESGLS